MENRSLSAMLSKVQSLADKVVVIAKDGVFFEFALVVNKVVVILNRLSLDSDLTDTLEIRKAVESIAGGLSRARVLLMSELKGREEELEELKRDLRRLLELVALTCVDLDEEGKERIKELRKEIVILISPELRSGESGHSTGQEIEGIEVGIEDVVMQIKNCSIGSGDEEEELMLALWSLNDFVRGRAFEHEWIRDENVVGILVNRLSLVKSSNVRSVIIKILRNLVAEYPDHKVDN